jgi:hypothetical protein
MNHLTVAQLSAHLDGVLAPDVGAEAARHLESCESCRGTLAALEAQDRSLGRSLAHDPGDKHFERLAARIEARITTGAAPRRAGVFDSIGSFFGETRTLVWVGSAAAVIVGAGIVYLTSRHAEAPYPGTLAGRVGQVAGEAAPPPAEESGRKEADTPSDQVAPGTRGDERAKDAQPVTGTAEGTAGGAMPARAYEVRRNAAGEDEAVRPPRTPFAVAPQPAPVPSADGEIRVQKRRFAEPLGDAKTRDESGARETVKQEAPPPQAATQAAPQPPTAMQKSLAAPPTVGSPSASAPSVSFAPPAAKPSAAILDRTEGGASRVCGVVKDPAGRVVAFASVTLVTTGGGATTDSHGYFCIEAPPGDQSLSVIAVGFAPLRRTVHVAAGLQEVTLKLEAVSALKETRVGATATRGREAPGGPAADAEVAGPDVFAALPDSLRFLADRAASLRAIAERTQSAPRVDGAAAAWERLLDRVKGQPAEVETRYRIAAARYRAWELAPNQRRAQAATEALTSYLVRAPAGERRNRVAVWLDKVKR